jgi:protein-S-isoprenylcysteine O-methyltransferase Ste14
VNNLANKTVLGFTQLITVLGILLLAPAWTLDYWQAWVYLFVFAASAALITTYLWKNDPKLLERRINAGPDTFTAATIAVSPDQKVVSTGPYAVVRHPMYSGALVMLFGTPLALGSWWGLLMCIPMVFTIAWRARDEEQFLFKNLSGYKEYCQTVRYRLMPLVW